MKNLLNNRWFIVIISIGAILLLAHSLILPFIDKPVYTDEAEVDDWMGSGQTTASDTSSSGSLKAVSTGKLLWNNRPQKDPFNTYSSLNRQDLQTMQNQANAVTDDISYTQPVLDALVAGKISRFAVVNGTIVEEGDQITGFKIHRIEQDGVWLQSGNGLQKLTLPKITLEQ